MRPKYRGTSVPSFFPLGQAMGQPPPKRLAASSRRVPVEEVLEALHQRTGSDLRSARDLEEHSSSKARPHLRPLPPFARRSPGRTAPCHQSQAAPAAALPLSKRWSSYIQNRSNLEPLPALQRHRPPPARRPPPSNSEEPREVKSAHGRALPWAWMFRESASSLCRRRGHQEDRSSGHGRRGRTQRHIDPDLMR